MITEYDEFSYDIECLPNLFTCVIERISTGMRWIFEVSDRINNSEQFCAFVRLLMSMKNARMVGYNNNSYDWFVCQNLYKLGKFTAQQARHFSDLIIKGTRETTFGLTIWPNKRLVPQLDLFKMNHYDNFAKSTSLKKLEVALRADNVMELGLDWDADVPPEIIDKVIRYNCWDVKNTTAFYHECKKDIDLRTELDAMFDFDPTSMPDATIGENFFIAALEAEQEGITGALARPKRIRQTFREEIKLEECIVDYVQFETPEFNRILDYFKASVLRIKPNERMIKTKGFFEGLDCEVGGIKFVFGLGGIHAARPNVTYQTDGKSTIRLSDVTSYYPSLSPANQFFPKHLSSIFCDVNQDKMAERAAAGKKSTLGAVIKLAMNAVYGKTNSEFSCLLDTKHTLRTTINGQLLLCMLSEWLLKIPTLELIQVNTDGVCYKVDNDYLPQADEVCAKWCKMTRLRFVHEIYKVFHQRDVNSYLGVFEDGKVKRKGAYSKEKEFHKNWDALIVPMAMEEFLLNGTPVEYTIGNHANPFDFCLSTNIKRKVDYCQTLDGDRQQAITRFYMTHDGVYLEKISPPTKPRGTKDTTKLDLYNSMLAMDEESPEYKTLYAQFERHTAIEKGYKVSICNDITDYRWSNLNHAWYIDQAKSLIRDVGINPDER